MKSIAWMPKSRRVRMNHFSKVCLPSKTALNDFSTFLWTAEMFFLSSAVSPLKCGQSFSATRLMKMSSSRSASGTSMMGAFGT